MLYNIYVIQGLAVVHCSSHLCERPRGLIMMFFSLNSAWPVCLNTLAFCAVRVKTVTFEVVPHSQPGTHGLHGLSMNQTVYHFLHR